MAKRKFNKGGEVRLVAYYRYSGGSGQTEHALRVFVGCVHAHKPLCSGAVDERGLVAPAVHVAVGHFARRE